MEEFYCGPAPVPHAVLAAWNMDGIAIAICLLLILAHRRVERRDGTRALLGSVFVLLLLYLSPLCALSVALFSARVLHHVLLIGLAAPLLAMAFPQRQEQGPPMALLVMVHAALLWAWHHPDLYAWGIRETLPYWLMQLTLLGSSVLLWRRLLASGAEIGASLLGLLATLIQMGMLGALLVFAQYPLYAPHLESALAFGLTPLADQQLAGLIMWVPASLPYLLAALLLVARRLDPARAGPS